ncbi:hypothetical protein FQA39_LY06114 [Lamprigera yunnana]|nr:hypothetical protein FQA39_LY06114 [Lamprigera yunnana]
MEEIQEQVDNDSGEINGICERLREQRTKLINVESKINQHKEESVQVCEDLKEQKREIVNYIEEKIKIGNGTGHNVITNYSEIEREAPKFHPSKINIPKCTFKSYKPIWREAMRGETETWYRTKVGEYRNFKQFWKGFMKNYWGTKEELVMKSKLYGTKFSQSLRVSREEYVLNKIIFFKQLEEKLLNKVRIIEVKKFDEVVRILEIHYQCGKDGVRNDGHEYDNHYNNYEQRKYSYIEQD